MRLIQKEVTVVFKGGPSAVTGTVSEDEADQLVVKGKASGVRGDSSVHVIPWSGVAYVRVHPEPR